MMQLSTQHSALSTSPAPAGVGWITLDEAARRSGRSGKWAVGHFRRLCAERWLAAGLARQDRSPDTGRMTWFIREDADPALARAKSPETLSQQFDLRQLSESKRTETLFRLRVLEQWEKALAAAPGNSQLATDNFLQHVSRDDGRELTRATLYRWRSAWRREGLAGLVDGRGEVEEGGEFDLFLAKLREIYLQTPPRSKALCYDIARAIAAEHGWPVPSLRTAVRRLDEIPKPTEVLMRFGDTAYTNQCQPYIERDYTTIASNYQWAGDHHQFDVFVQDPGRPGKVMRPWLTGWMDMRSRYLTGWTIQVSAGNTDTILAAFCDGVKLKGVPEQVLIDNGKDYDSKDIQGQTKRERRLRLDIDPDRCKGVFCQLGVATHHCPPFHPQSKPIERQFGTICRRFSPRFQTYCGNSPENRPEDCEDKVAAGLAPTLAEFIDLFRAWLESDYHQSAHEGQGMDGRCPAEIFTACLGTIKTAPPELLDLLCQRRTRPVKVGRNGVTYKGLRYGQFEPELHRLLGREVVLRIDDRDISKVSVWTLDDKLICVARQNQLIPADATAEVKREAVRQRARVKRVDREYHEVRHQRLETMDETISRVAADRRQPALPAVSVEDLPPTSMRPVQTPIAGELAGYRKALDRVSNRPFQAIEGIDLLALADSIELPGPQAPERDFDLINALSEDRP
jgi:putative transposase